MLLIAAGLLGDLRLTSHGVHHSPRMDTLGIEPRASRMLSGCDTTTPRALEMCNREPCGLKQNGLAPWGAFTTELTGPFASSAGYALLLQAWHWQSMPTRGPQLPQMGGLRAVLQACASRKATKTV